MTFTEMQDQLKETREQVTALEARMELLNARQQEAMIRLISTVSTLTQKIAEMFDRNGWSK